MKAFQFKLQRILDFRQAKLTEEERKLKLFQMELRGVERQIEDVRLTRLQSSHALTSVEGLRGHDLQALEGYRAMLTRAEQTLLQKRTVCIQKLRRQQESYRKSRRDYRLMEELRKRRFAEWLQATGRELDQLASDLYLARWDHQRSG